MSLLLLQLGLLAVGLPSPPNAGSFRNRRGDPLVPPDNASASMGLVSSVFFNRNRPSGMNASALIGLGSPGPFSSKGSTPAPTPTVLSPRASSTQDAFNNASPPTRKGSAPFSSDQDAFMEISAQKEALDAQCDALKKNVDDLTKERAGMDARINKLEAQVRQLQQEIVGLKQTGVTDQAALLQKEAALKLAQDALADARRQTGDAQQAVETYKRQVAELSAEMGAREKLMADLAEARAAESQVAQLRSSLQEKIVELQKNADTIAQLRAELDKIAKTAGVSEAVLTELESLRTKNEEQERILASFREQIELQEKRIAEKTETLQQAETKLENARATQKRLETSLDAAHGQCAQQKQKLEDDKTQLETMAQRIAELEGQLAFAGITELELKQTLAAQLQAVQGLVGSLTEIFEKQSKLPPVPPIGVSLKSAFEKKLIEISDQQKHIEQLLNACLTSFAESTPETARSSRSTQLMALPLQADQNSEKLQKERDIETRHGQLLSAVMRYQSESKGWMEKCQQLRDENQILIEERQQLHNTIDVLQNQLRQPKEKAKGCCG